MADPERSTELLWGTGARRGLSLERIVRAAVELADAEGLAAVSMRRLAERLGFTTMALYRHVPGKTELLDLMRDAVHDEHEPSGAEGAAEWRAELETWARREREAYRRHPWLVETVDVRHVPGPRAVAAFERGLEIVARTGLPPAEVVASVELLAGLAGSAARQSAVAARAERSTGVSDQEWWNRRDSLFVHFDRYPTLSRLYEQGAYDTPLDPFEFGLQRVLDGIEARVRDESRDESKCEVCGRPVERPAAGRPRSYCSPACRQRAYRARRSG